jgi:TP901 family phage tail tape measure protein
VATIASLIVRIGADPSGLRADLNRASGAIRQFARNASQVSEKALFGKAFSTSSTNIAKATQDIAASASRARAQFASVMSDLKARLARDPLFKPDDFRKQARLAGEAFNAEILRKLKQLEHTQLHFKLFSDDDFRRLKAGLTSQLKDTRTPKFEEVREGTNRLSAIGDTVRNAGQTMTRTLTLPIAAFGVAAIHAAGQFEAAMNNVRAKTQGTEADFQKLRAAALDFGQKTKFNPAEVADGLAIMGQAGLTAAQSMTALPKILALAMTESISFDQAASTAIRTTKGFGKSIDELGGVTDVLVAASLAGVTNLEELGVSFKYAGSLASLSGQKFNDMAAAMTIMSDRGIFASQAGVALRQAFVQLQTPSSRAKKALEDIDKRLRSMGEGGLHLKDLKGNLLPLPAILAQFEKAGVKGSEMMTIFGRTGAGMAVLLQAGSKEIVRMSHSFDNAGGMADRVAKQQFTGFNAQLKQLTGSFMALAVAIGDTGILGFLTKLVKSLTNMIKGLRETNPGLLKFASISLVILAALGPLATGIGTIITQVALLKLAVFALTGKEGLAGLGALLTPGGIILAGLASLAVAFYVIARRAGEVQAAVSDFGRDIAGFSTEQLRAIRRDVAATLQELQQQRADFQSSNHSVANAVTGGHQVFGEDSKKAKQYLDLLKQVQIFQGKLKTVDELLESRSSTGTGANNIVTDFKNQMQGVQDALAGLQFGPTFGAGADDFLKNIRINAKEAIAELDRVERATRGVEDRSQQLAEPLARVKDLYGQILKLLDGMKNKHSAVKTALELIANQLQESMLRAEKPDSRGFADLTARADDLLTHIDLIKDSTDNTVQRARLLRPVLAEAQPILDELNARIRAEGDNWRNVIGLIRLRNRLLRELPSVTPLEQASPDTFKALDGIAARFQKAQADFERLSTSGNNRAADEAHRQMDEAARDAQHMAGVISDLISGISDPDLQMAIWEQYVELMRRLGIIIPNVRSKSERLIKTLDKIGSVASAVRILGDALGGLGEGFGKIVDGALQAVDSLKEVAAAKDEMGNFDLFKALPGIAGAVAGGVSVLSGLFGGDKELKSIQRENNKRLQELSQHLEQVAGGLGNDTKISLVIPKINIAEANAARGRAIIGDKGIPGANQAAIENINKQLEGTGVTFANLQKAADELGIQIFDTNGKIRPEVFDQLRQAADLAAEGLRHFSNSIETQTQIAETKAKLQTGAPLDDMQSLQIMFDTLQKMAPELANFIGAIDTTTEEGRRALRERLLALIQAIEDGQIKASDFGAFENADALLAWAGEAADALNSLSDAADQASQNVPQGFKLALREFQSQTAKDIEDMKPSIDPGALTGEPKKLADALRSPLAEQTDRTVDMLTQIRDAVLRASGQPAPEKGATEGGSDGDPASKSFLERFAGLSAKTTARETAAASADAMKSLIQTILSGGSPAQADSADKFKSLIDQIIGGSSAAKLRSIQESILKQQSFEPGSEAAGLNPDKVSQVVHMNTNFNGDIVIQGANKSPQQLWQEIKQAARNDAVAKFGDSSKWGQVP